MLVSLELVDYVDLARPDRREEVHISDHDPVLVHFSALMAVVPQWKYSVALPKEQHLVEWYMLAVEEWVATK